MLTEDLHTTLHSYYNELHSWLTTKTLGGHSHKSTFQYYDKSLWLPVKELLVSAYENENRSLPEAELLSCCYTGEFFRIHRFYKNKHSHVYPLGCYQSWSRESGLEALSKIGGEVILIRGHATISDYAISTSELLLNMQPDIWFLFFSDQHKLSRYKNEHEVVMPIRVTNVDEILVVEAAHLCDWRACGIPLPKEKWFRNNLK